MDNLKINPVSFKGAYKLQGSSEVLDEVCWFLQKKKNSLNPNFDFLDLRLVKKSLNETDKILGCADISDLKNNKSEEIITEHLLDLISIRKGSMAPFRDLKNTENIDLFLTNSDKKIVEPKTINMVEDSVLSCLGNLNFAEKARVLLDNLAQMRESLRQGKPIANIKERIAQQYLTYLNLPQIAPIKAEAVLEKIQKGRFDISDWEK